MPEVVLECEGRFKGKPLMLRGAGVLVPDEADRSCSGKPLGAWVGVLAPDEPDRSCNANVATEVQESVLRWP